MDIKPESKPSKGQNMINKFVVLGLSALTVTSNAVLSPARASAFEPQGVEAPTLVALKSAQGSFQSAQKTTQGNFRIKNFEGKNYLQFDTSFATDSGPNVEVLLHQDAVPQSYNSTNYVSLGELKSFQGSQWYAIPDTVDVTQFQSISIWCREFDVTFGFGTLQG